MNEQQAKVIVIDADNYQHWILEYATHLFDCMFEYDEQENLANLKIYPILDSEFVVQNAAVLKKAIEPYLETIRADLQRVQKNIDEYTQQTNEIIQTVIQRAVVDKLVEIEQAWEEVKAETNTGENA